jgi:flagellar motor switch protein FliN
MAGEQLAEAHIDELVDLPDDGGATSRLMLSDLAGVPLTIGAELGRARLRVRDILGLKVGSLVTLTKVAGEMADVTMNGIHFAQGEVVVIGDILHVRIADFVERSGQSRKSNG